MSEDRNTAEGQALRLESVNSQVAALLRRPEVAQRLHAAGSAEWSTVQILGHMIELINYWMRDIRALAVATGEPPRFGRTLDAPERLDAVQRGADSDPADLLRQLDSAVRAAAVDIRGMTPAQRAKTGLHNRLGEIAVSNAIDELVVGHLEAHLAQMRQTLALPG
jgi:uncharacterized damage-inducible protein DinB